MGDQPVVLRHSGRPEASLHWEFDLLDHLHAHGLLVPEVVATVDGHRDVTGWHVQRRFSGRYPDGSARDSTAVRTALPAVHSATPGWSQRPGSRSAAELLTTHRGADVDLSALPGVLRHTVRVAWSAVDPQDRCVIHGDAEGATPCCCLTGAVP